MSWGPLLAGERRDRARAMIREIADATAIDTLAPGELFDHAVVRGYLAADETVPDPDDVSGAALAAAIGTTASRGGLPLFGGVAELGWTVAHVASGDDADELCGAIDDTFARVLATPWQGSYDLIDGLVGFGIYALERGDAGRAIAHQVVGELERLAAPGDRGVAWHTPARRLPAWQRARAPDGYRNLGMAHGSAGVIALLARIVTAWSDARARGLLVEAVAFLGSRRRHAPRGWYPAWEAEPVGDAELGPDGAPIGRLAWCYGDLGIALALLAAGRALGDDACASHALALARECAARPRDDGAFVVDGGVCHGAAGIAHQLSRLYHATGEAVFAAGAVRWFDELVAMRSTLPIAGFPRLDRTTEPAGWRADASILDGAGGVALVLHALTSSTAPAWDRRLLLDV